MNEAINSNIIDYKDFLYFHSCENLFFNSKKATYTSSNLYKILINSDLEAIPQKTFDRNITTMNKKLYDTFHNMKNFHNSIPDSFNSLHTRIFYQRFLFAFFKHCIYKPIFDPEINIRSIHVTPVFFPLFVSLIFSVNKEKQGWKVLKSFVLETVKRFFTDDYNFLYTSASLNENTLNELYTYWLDTFLPDDLYEYTMDVEVAIKVVNKNALSTHSPNLSSLVTLLPQQNFISHYYRQMFFKQLQVPLSLSKTPYNIDITYETLEQYNLFLRNTLALQANAYQQFIYKSGKYFVNKPTTFLKNKIT